MNARGFFKKIVAVTLAGSMVFGSAMVTMADADSEQTNAQGYKPGQVYRGDQNKFDAKGRGSCGIWLGLQETYRLCRWIL